MNLGGHIEGFILDCSRASVDEATPNNALNRRPKQRALARCLGPG